MRARWWGPALAALLLLLVSGCGHVQRFSLPLAERATPNGLFRLDPPEGERVVYLTIDDGPSYYTVDILNLLAEYGATATFFVATDHLEDYGPVLADATSSGHRLAHHMRADADATLFEDREFVEQFTEAHCLLSSLQETPPEWFRPPRGTYDPDRMAPVLARLGYADRPDTRIFVLATFAPWDAGGITETRWGFWNRSMARIYGDQVAGAAFPGAIVVFHDGPRQTRTENTLISLEVFLKKATKRGFTISAMPDPDPEDRILPDIDCAARGG